MTIQVKIVVRLDLKQGGQPFGRIWIALQNFVDYQIETRILDVVQIQSP